MNAPNGFSNEQQAYLQGLMLGSDVARKVHQLPILSGSGTGIATTAPPNTGTTGNALPGPAGQPESITSRAKTASLPSHLTSLHALALSNTIATGRPLVAEEKAKRDKDALQMWGEIGERAARSEFPRGTDVFLTKYHGLFYVAPAQNSFMCRLRLAGGILRADQLSGLAQAAEDYAGGYVDITTRANLQLREIPPGAAQDLLMHLRDLGIVTLGTGADNVRNVTCSPLSGLDATELMETLPLARALHYHILHHRELFGLPRKFNIAFDGSGRISSLAETNDVSWHAVRLTNPGPPSNNPNGIAFLLGLGGITGHGDFARPTAVVAMPDQCLAICDAILRVFVLHGDRTNRKRARLKYLLDDWGFEKFLSHVEDQLGSTLTRVAATDYFQPDSVNRWAHVGVHEQKQAGLNYIGVVVPAARLNSSQLRALADIASRDGSGQVRLTVWQNFLIPNIRQCDVPAVQAELEAIDLDWRASGFHAGLVACTGNQGCKFAGSDTKRHSLLIADYLKSRFQLDQPINIHVTGCHHSCAQHAIGDIGLIATKVAVGDDLVEGYHILIGGRTGSSAQLGRLVLESIPFDDVPGKIADIVAIYLQRRPSAMSFAQFAAEHDWLQSFSTLAPEQSGIATRRSLQDQSLVGGVV